MHFLRPYFFTLLLPALWICWRIWCVQAANHRWQLVCDAHLLPYLSVDNAKFAKKKLAYCVAMALFITVIALAGPSWQQPDLPLYSSHVPVVILLDVSEPMLARDITPSRLQRAKYKILDLLKERKGGPMALLAFTSEPFVVTPLTDDLSTISNLLDVLEPTIMPVQGYDLTKGLTQAQQVIKRLGSSAAEIVVVTSQGASAGALAKARALASQGIYTSVLGVGTEAGGPIVSADGQLLKDDNGNVRTAQLPVAQLRALAKNGGGLFSQVMVGNEDVTRLQPILSRKGEASVSNNTALLWQDNGHWLILLLLPLVLLVFRRGVLS